MDTDLLLDILRDAETWLRAEYGVSALWVFGPAAQREAGPIREVDLLIEPARPLLVVEFLAVRRRLEAVLGGVRVEPVLIPAVWPQGLDDVTTDAYRVF